MITTELVTKLLITGMSHASEQRGKRELNVKHFHSVRHTKSFMGCLLLCSLKDNRHLEVKIV